MTPRRSRLILPIALLAAATLLAGGDRFTRGAWPFTARLLARLPPLPDAPADLTEPVTRDMAAAHAAARADPLSAEKAARLGMLLHAFDFLEDARTCYRRASLIEPDAFEHLYRLALVSFELGLPEESAAALDEALGLHRAYLPALLAAADAALWCDRPAQARDWLARAIALQPDCAAAHWMLGRVEIRAGDHAAAARQFRRALELTPDFGEARFALAMVERGTAGMGDAQRELALLAGSRSARMVRDPLREAVLALRRDGSDAEAAGTVHLRAGRYADAAQALAEAAALRPKDGLLLYQYGSALLGAGQAKPAADALSRAAELLPRNARVRESLGAALLADGRSAAAVNQLRLALSIDPNDGERRGRIESLLARHKLSLTDGATVAAP